jgi:hypothetical protein
MSGVGGLLARCPQFGQMRARMTLPAFEMLRAKFFANSARIQTGG